MGDYWYFDNQFPAPITPDIPLDQYSYPLPLSGTSTYDGQWNTEWGAPQNYPVPMPLPEGSMVPYCPIQSSIPTSIVTQQYGYDPSQQYNLQSSYNEPQKVSYSRSSEIPMERVDFCKELEEYKAVKRAQMDTASTSSSSVTKTRSTYSRRSRSSSRKRSKSPYTSIRRRSRQRSRSPLRSRSRLRSRSPLRSRSYRSSRSRHRSRSHQSSRCRQRSRSHQSIRSRNRSRSPSRSRVRARSQDRKRPRVRSRSRIRTRERSVSKLEKHTKKIVSERDEILDKWKKNYCNTEVKISEKLKEFTKKTEDILEAERTIWTRSTPAEMYYKRDDTNFKLFKGTPKLVDLVTTFKETLVDRAAKVNALKPKYVPPPRRTRKGLCKHKSEISSSDSDSSDATLSDEEDYSMEELQRKQQHPDRLDSEMWYNDPGEMNDGPLCRCSHKSRKSGIRHEIYPGEKPIPKCDIYSNNGEKLYCYRIIISPPTNFLIKAPTIIHHDEHEFIFEGFSILSHAPLAKLPPCKVIRFNIEYTILYFEEKNPENFTVAELDLFVNFLFKEILELVDLELTTPLDSEHCSQFHFMPRFVRELPDNGKEILCMQQIIQYLLNSSVPLIQKDELESMVKMSQYEWQNFADDLKGMVVTYPGKKPSSVRVDQLDRNIDLQKEGDYKFPEIVHFGIRPPQLSYAGNPEYQKAWREYVKFRHLIANMSKPTFDDKRRLEAKENKLQEMRTQGQMKRDVTVAVSAEGFYRTGIMCDIVQHAMLIPVLVCHLRFHNALNVLEQSVEYKFKNRALLQLALTHPSYRENFGTNPDHARNSLTNCGIRQPEYGDRRIHYMNTRKRGINTLINIMSRFGKQEETESNITHNERLEFLGDAVVEFLSSIHLFFSFPHLEEGGLATYRAAIVQNQHLALLARVLKLDQFMLYAHGSDLCHDLELKHAMANCFEALMGALFLDGGIDVADRVFSNTLYKDEPELYKVWVNLPPHPLQEQEPLGDRHWIEKFEILQKLTGFEKSINVEFNHIRLLARAFTDRSVGYTNLTMGSNQRLEFLGDTVLQLIASEYLYRYFPEHHEGHLSLLRSSLVNNRTQAVVCDDLGMAQYALYNNPKPELKTKDRADLLEALIGALYVDQGMEYCEVFCEVTLFPRLQDFIMNQDWNDPKSKLQQCCLTLRTMDGGEPDIPVYKVIECKGPTNTRVYTVAVYFRGRRLASAMGHSIQQAEMNAAKNALEISHDLFPQLDHQKRVIAKSMKKQKKNKYSKTSSFDRDPKSPESYSRNRFKSVSPHSKNRGNDSDDSNSSKITRYSRRSPSVTHKSCKISDKDNQNQKKKRRSSSRDTKTAPSTRSSREQNRYRSEDKSSENMERKSSGRLESSPELPRKSRSVDKRSESPDIKSSGKSDTSRELNKPRRSVDKTSVNMKRKSSSRSETSRELNRESRSVDKKSENSEKYLSRKSPTSGELHRRSRHVDKKSENTERKSSSRSKTSSELNRRSRSRSVDKSEKTEKKSSGRSETSKILNKRRSVHKKRESSEEKLSRRLETSRELDRRSRYVDENSENTERRLSGGSEMSMELNRRSTSVDEKSENTTRKSSNTSETSGDLNRSRSVDEKSDITERESSGRSATSREVNNRSVDIESDFLVRTSPGGLDTSREPIEISRSLDTKSEIKQRLSPDRSDTSSELNRESAYKNSEKSERKSSNISESEMKSDMNKRGRSESPLSVAVNDESITSEIINAGIETMKDHINGEDTKSDIKERASPARSNSSRELKRSVEENNVKLEGRSSDVSETEMKAGMNKCSRSEFPLSIAIKNECNTPESINISTETDEDDANEENTKSEIKERISPGRSNTSRELKRSVDENNVKLEGKSSDISDTEMKADMNKCSRSEFLLPIAIKDECNTPETINISTETSEDDANEEDTKSEIKERISSYISETELKLDKSKWSTLNTSIETWEDHTNIEVENRKENSKIESRNSQEKDLQKD